MKIGVIADTHIPDAMSSLPSRVTEVFRNMDIILHAGDICDLETLQELEEITITMAVSGNGDQEMVRRYVEPSRVVEFATRRIGMAHGHRGALVELADLVRFKLWGRPRYQGLYRHLLEQFPDVDCIIFGHTHQPYAKMHTGPSQGGSPSRSILLFNPGTVVSQQGSRPSVGILNVTEKSISGRIVYL